MSILINKETKVIVQGITGSQGKFHAKNMLKYGTNIVAGVTPFKGGTKVEGIPVFNTVKEAKSATNATASIIFVPPAFTAEAIFEAVDAELELVVCITENVPVLDMLKVKSYMEGKKTRLIGPNCPGIITAGECKIGIMPNDIHLKGHVGVVSRSGSLTYEAIKQLTMAGIGQSSSIGIGGDPLKGSNFLDVIKAFEADPETYAVVMIGEIGGNGEERAAKWIEENMTKPVAAFIGGQSAPPGKRMGHAGAIISGSNGSAAQKIRVLEQSGIPVAKASDMIAETLISKLKKEGLYENCLVNNIK